MSTAADASRTITLVLVADLAHRPGRLPAECDGLTAADPLDELVEVGVCTMRVASARRKSDSVIPAPGGASLQGPVHVVGSVSDLERRPGWSGWADPQHLVVLAVACGHVQRAVRAGADRA